MVKPIAHAIHALSRVAEIKPLAMLGDTYEDAEPWTDRLVRGRSYMAQVLSRLDDKTFSISIGNHTVAMALQTELEAGQSIRLRYLSAVPTPTFMLVSETDTEEPSTASLSKAAQLIGHSLQTARQSGNSAVHEAPLAISKTPFDAIQLAADIKHALSHSGLFYESHLADYVLGTRPLADVMQEAQSRDHSVSGGLLAKQLGILEQQRLLWHGEIWPGQTMQWQLQLEDKSKDSDASHAMEEARPLSSSMTLHLPHLGKVTARIDMAQGNMRILLSAEQPVTVDKLSDAHSELLTAIEDHAHIVATFAVVQHD